MTVEQLKNARTATPFRPFTIRMADGRTFHVAHPDFVLQSPSGRTVIVFRDSENFSILDLLLMTEIDFDDASPESGKRGRGRNRN